MAAATGESSVSTILPSSPRFCRVGRKVGASLSYEAISGAVTLASVVGKRTWQYPESPVLDFTAVTEPADVTRWTSLDEDSVQGFLVNRGFNVVRGTRVWCSPVCVPGLRRLPWIPDLIVNERLIVEVDSPSVLGGGPSHTPGFPSRDMHRMDMFRSVGFATLAVRLHGLNPLPGHRCVTSERGLTPAVYRAIHTAVLDLMG